MHALHVSDAAKSFGRVAALSGAELRVSPGSLTVVVGPSGCGKTTLLRCIAGFDRLDRGTIHLADRQLSGPGLHVRPHRRRIAVVPQEGALFPHLDVAGNVGFGLRRQARTAGRIDEVLELVGLTGFAKRMPHQLSGGQQQRVALARALAPRPALILLDEPFSALDAGLRTQLRRDVRDALRADNATAVLVTHDQDEALSVADQIAVMRDGAIAQAGPPATVYSAPADPWVAEFIGDAVLMPGTYGSVGVMTALGTVAVESSSSAGRDVVVMLRPEQISVGPPGSAGAPATVHSVDFHGHDTVVVLQLDDGALVTARVAGPHRPFEVADEARLQIVGTARTFPLTAPA